MKKSKLLIFLLAAVSSVSLISAATLVGCANNDGDGTQIEQPGGEQPGGEEPGGEQPGGEQPGGEEPGGEEPGGEEPGGEEPGGEEPGGEEPGEEDPPVVEYENVTTTVDAAALAAAPVGSDGKLTADTTVGKFTFGQGTKPEDSGATINTQGKDITIVLGGRTNSVSFTAEGASSSAPTAISLVSVVDGVETVIKDFGTAENKVPGSYAYGTGADESMPAGTYIIRTDRSARVTNLTIVEELEKSDMSGITVRGATAKFLAGRTFDSNGLNVTLNYENGRADAITSGYQVDSSAVDMTTAGKYTVTVSYSPAGAETPFTATYDVVVYAAESIEVYNYSLTGTRVTLPVQKLFAVNGDFNYNGLAVHAIAKAPGVDEAEDFVLAANEFSVSGADLASAGEKTITVSACGKSATYGVNAVDLSAVTDKTTVKVDAAAAAVGVTEGVLTVKSINDAVQAFKLLETGDDVIKTISVAAGQYKEKVEIDIPNVKLVGTGATAKDTVIWYDALAGQLDPSGSMAHSTDGSATVSVRESAEGFYAENITFKNYYNTNALYEQSKLEMSDTQAVACLVRADKAYFKNCFFTSYHDTLYADEGRQVYESCEIEGRTDYIFGSSATAYFKNCKINTIGAGDEKNGGYIVATKGAAGMTYGYIFDGCTLGTTDEVITSEQYAELEAAGTLDTQIVAGSVSLARGWDVNMHLAFINCSISDAYSLEAYGNTASPLNDRYTKMNAEPVASQIIEYGNTGAGALTEEITATADPATGVIAGLCKVIGADAVTAYTTPATIFALENAPAGLYADDWNGQPVQIATITIKCGANQQVIYGYVGGGIPNADLLSAQTALMPEGHMLDKYSLTDGGEALDVTTYTLTGDVEIYMITKEIPAGALQVVETIKADDYEIGYSLRDKQVDTEWLTIVGAGSGDTKAADSLTGAFNANDGSGLSFNKGFLPGGNGRTVEITAKKDITITYYYTLTDSSWGPKSGTISWTIDGVAGGTSTETITANVAHCVEIELKAGQKAVITPSGSRIVTFGVVVEGIAV